MIHSESLLVLSLLFVFMPATATQPETDESEQSSPLLKSLVDENYVYKHMSTFQTPYSPHIVYALQTTSEKLSKQTASQALNFIENRKNQLWQEAEQCKNNTAVKERILRMLCFLHTYEKDIKALPHTAHQVSSDVEAYDASVIEASE